MRGAHSRNDGGRRARTSRTLDDLEQVADVEESGDGEDDATATSAMTSVRESRGKLRDGSRNDSGDGDRDT